MASAARIRADRTRTGSGRPGGGAEELNVRISVVIATYNRAGLLRNCLEQLTRQRFEPGDEVLVADNASTDDTPQVIQHAAERFPVTLRAVREGTPGKTPALNAGIAAAGGDVLGLTDDDVIVAEDWLEQIRRVFSDPTLALVGGRVDPWWELPPPSWLGFDHDRPYGRMSSPLALLHYGDAQPLGARTAVGANLAVRRDVLDAVGGFSAHLGRLRGTLLCGEDHEFCQRVVRAGYRCEYRPELCVRHWVPASRLTLAYYTRWFYWSGITHARLDADEAEMVGRPTGRVPGYVWRRLATAPVQAAVRLLRGRLTDAVASAMDGAFACGFVVRRFTGGRERQEVRVAHQQAPQLPAPTRAPAIPTSGPGAGKLN
jgi:GT2 family glycosyltransferase